MKQKIVLTFLLLTATLLPIKADGNHDLIPIYDLDLQSQNYILVDPKTGQTLAEKNHDASIHPASITKVLTVITAIEALGETSLDTLYTIPPEVFEGLDPIASVAGFQEGDQVTLNDLLHGIMLPSGADATRAISSYLTQDPEKLVVKMNRLAQRIGMKNSHFVNTSGLDDPKHLTTLDDLALLLRYALENPTFESIYKTETYLTSSTPSHPNGIELTNESLSVAHQKGYTMIKGAKSGTTDLAERALSSVAEDASQSYIFISTNAPFENRLYTQVIDHGTVYQHVIENYQYAPLLYKNTTIQTIPIKHGRTDFEIWFKNDIMSYLPKDYDPKDIKIEFIPSQKEFEAPLPKDFKMGEVRFNYKGKQLLEKEVINNEIIKLSYLKVAFEASKIIGFILAVGLGILGVVYLIYRQWKDYRDHKYYLKKLDRRSRID